jgi:hypothetical protein
MKNWSFQRSINGQSGVLEKTNKKFPTSISLATRCKITFVDISYHAECPMFLKKKIQGTLQKYISLLKEHARISD